MAGWYPTRNTTSMLSRSTKLTIGVVGLAVALVFAIPVAFIVALFLMLFGHVVGGLILIGASVLAATAAIGVAALCGVRQLRHFREMLTRGTFTGGTFTGGTFTGGSFTGRDANDVNDVGGGGVNDQDPRVVRLDTDDYDRY
jgi:ABC-type multidrug transport system permease subunit